MSEVFSLLSIVSFVLRMDESFTLTSTVRIGPLVCAVPTEHRMELMLMAPTMRNLTFVPVEISLFSSEHATVTCLMAAASIAA